MRLSFSEGKGIRFETETIDEWLAQVQQKDDKIRFSYLK